MSLDILGQFPSPPVPNLPAMAMAINAVMPQHQQPIMTQPPVSMAMPVTAPPVIGMTPNPAAQPPATFITNFPPVQVNIRHFITDNNCVMLSQNWLIVSLTYFRLPSLMTMISRTSRKPPKLELEMTHSQISKERQGEEHSPAWNHHPRAGTIVAFHQATSLWVVAYCCMRVNAYFIRNANSSEKCIVKQHPVISL